MAKGKEPKFYQTPEFKKLNQLWITGKESKLKQSGFEDIEYPNGALKVKNKRTQAYLQQDVISMISSALCSYVENPEADITADEKHILELHSRGIYLKEIIRITGRAHQTIRRIIKKHTPLALGLYAKNEE